MRVKKMSARPRRRRCRPLADRVRQQRRIERLRQHQRVTHQRVQRREQLHRRSELDLDRRFLHVRFLLVRFLHRLQQGQWADRPEPVRDVGLHVQDRPSRPQCLRRGVKDQIVVNLKNTGSGKCSMHGFPGVQLVGPDGLGDTGPDAARTDASGSTVSIGPGEETRFLLRYIPSTSGSAKTYTRLSVTPPNEKVSEIVNLNDLAITIAAPSGDAPDVYVDPIGYHVGSGK